MIKYPNILERAILYLLWFPFERTEATKLIRYALDAPGELIIATDGWKLVGALRYRYECDFIYVSYLGSRKKGAGSALINEVKKQKETIVLHCEEHNLGFYGKLGFTFLRQDEDRSVMIFKQ